MIAACLDEQIEFSLTLSRNRRVTKAIEASPGKSNGKPRGTTSSATRPHNLAPPDPTDRSLSTPRSQARPKKPQGKLVQASRSRMRHYAHARPHPTETRQRPLEITHPRIQAKSGGGCDPRRRLTS